eukprot:TRINITY_DN36660_c0_g1_i1.p1 TRINITY_DN36660_c0_g1~~TRINITY_DN36660_c0_g1_i1.p1  ORF type:complete len:816 (-),score=212.92 TRINITY_DN36660_c0_g1_i1:217-2664(-)
MANASAADALSLPPLSSQSNRQGGRPNTCSASITSARTKASGVRSHYGGCGRVAQCQAHQSRFERVLGGWRPHLQQRLKKAPWKFRRQPVSSSDAVLWSDRSSMTSDELPGPSGNKLQLAAILTKKKAQEKPLPAVALIGSLLHSSAVAPTPRLDPSVRAADKMAYQPSRREPKLKTGVWYDRIRHAAERSLEAEFAIAVMADEEGATAMSDDLDFVVGLGGKRWSMDSALGSAVPSPEGLSQRGSLTGGRKMSIFGNALSPANGQAPGGRRASFSGMRRSSKIAVNEQDANALAQMMMPTGDAAQDEARRGSMDNAFWLQNQEEVPNTESSSCGSELIKQEALEHRGLPEVLTEVREIREMRQARRQSKELIYAELLPQSDVVKRIAEYADVTLEDVAALATLFAEFDGTLSGFIHSHTLLALLRRYGRYTSANEFRTVLERFGEKFESDSDSEDSDSDEEEEKDKGESTKNKGMDFLDVLEQVGFLSAADMGALRFAYAKWCDRHARKTRPTEMSEIAGILGMVGTCPPLVQLRRTLEEVGVEHVMVENNRLFVFSDEEQLYELWNQCRQLLQIASHESAGFSHEEVVYFRDAYDKARRWSAETMNGKRKTGGKQRVAEELDPLGLTMLLSELGLRPKNDDENDFLHRLVACADRDGNGTYSFWECLHLVRKFMDTRDIVNVVTEYEAALESGLTPKEVEAMRELYVILVDDSGERGLTYSGFTKAVQTIGINITMESNTRLQTIFQKHLEEPDKEHDASWSRVLSFARFLEVMGELVLSNFAGLRAAMDRWMGQHDFQKAWWQAKRKSVGLR